MSRNVIRAHSVAEAYLYLLVQSCPTCKHGSLEPDPPVLAEETPLVQMTAACRNCSMCEEYHFQVDGPVSSVDPLSDTGPINSSGQKSEIIDVVQWISLANLLVETGESTPDKTEQRWRKYRAAQCLEEALRFFPADSEVPVETAFFSEKSRETFRNHPQRFTRERVLALRARLPAVGVESRVSEGEGKRRSWWKFWN